MSKVYTNKAAHSNKRAEEVMYTVVHNLYTACNKSGELADNWTIKSKTGLGMHL